MNITCLIVDDEPLARNLLTDYVHKIPYLTLVGACARPLEALEWIHREAIDLLFLDIQMPEITGISLLKSMKKKPLVILTTAYSQYALEGYELDVMDYLLKPISFDRFLKSVEKARERLLSLPVPAPVPVSGASDVGPKPSFVFVKDGTKLIKVFWDDILYIEGLKDYVTLHTKTQKVVAYQRLKSLEEQLDPDQFIRIHHSYIVSIKAIDSIEKNEVKIGEALLPISDSYRKAFKDKVDKLNLM